MSIIVHNGKAHADDFLAACVCLFKLNKDLFRSNFSEKMLEDPDFWVLDQGARFEPELHNFDHHHLNQEICSFTMILDYFYGSNYREYLPNLKFIEIYDSFGSKKASEFAGMNQNKLELLTSPIQSSILKAFSKINGIVEEPFLSIMKLIGSEICENIEKMEILLKILDQNCNFYEFEGIEIMDTTKCVIPDNYTYDQLPTKVWCKNKKISPTIILTVDSRDKKSYRMVCTNNSLVFKTNKFSSFTHASGFLTSFKNYDDFKEILKNYTTKIN
jgi:hypothetical protein